MSKAGRRHRFCDRIASACRESSCERRFTDDSYHQPKSVSNIHVLAVFLLDLSAKMGLLGDMNEQLTFRYARRTHGIRVPLWRLNAL